LQQLGILITSIYGFSVKNDQSRLIEFKKWLEYHTELSLLKVLFSSGFGAMF
jgi:hypothetical protein